MPREKWSNRLWGGRGGVGCGCADWKEDNTSHPILVEKFYMRFITPRFSFPFSVGKQWYIPYHMPGYNRISLRKSTSPNSQQPHPTLNYIQQNSIYPTNHQTLGPPSRERPLNSLNCASAYSRSWIGLNLGSGTPGYGQQSHTQGWSMASGTGKRITYPNPDHQGNTTGPTNTKNISTSGVVSITSEDLTKAWYYRVSTATGTVNSTGRLRPLWLMKLER